MTMRGHFSSIKDAAELYVEISKEHIMPFMIEVNKPRFDLTKAEINTEVQRLTKRSEEIAAAITKNAVDVSGWENVAMRDLR